MAGTREEPAADQPSPSSSDDGRGGASEVLWNLEEKVDQLKLKVLWLEERQSNASAERGAPPGGAEAELQAQVTWLKTRLEEHLRMFENVFSNTELLETTTATLELDQLWQLMKTKDGKKEKKKKKKRGGVREGGETRGRGRASGH